MAATTEFFENYGPSFLGLQLLRLYNEIDQGGTKAIAANSGLPARVASLLVYLGRHGPSSATTLAKAISVSHQLVSQRIDILNKHKLITRVPDPEDQRRVLIKLNVKGVKAAAEMEAICKVADEAYRQLFKEIDADVFAGVVKACRALEERPLDLRIRDIGASRKQRNAKKAA